jgi:glycosyltransferase involved in cell wall biosynthesis
LLRARPWAFYLGQVSHEGICAALRQVNAVINSSRSEGGMPNAVLEAMSQGVPVLASDIEGHRTILEDGQDGFLFGSPEEFMEKAERLLTEPATADALGQRARRKMATQFTPEGEIGGYLTLYRSLTGKEA